MSTPVIESSFLNRSPMPETRDAKKVLVLGQNGMVSDLPTQLVREGFEVIQIGGPADQTQTEGVSILADAKLLEVQGFVGAFDVILQTPSGKITEHVGFIVAAPEPDTVPKFASYGLKHSESVITLSDLDALKSSGVVMPWATGGWYHVVFLCGLEGESDPGLFSRFMDQARSLQEISQVQTYLFTRNVKVAAPGVERLYREVREAGTLFFRFEEEGPEFHKSSEGLILRFRDPVLNVDMELAPDLVVVDELLRLPASLKPVLEAIPSASLTGPYLQSESARFQDVTTAKAGIYAVAASRGAFIPDLVKGDVDALVLRLKSALLEKEDPKLPGPPTVDPETCTMCLTCVRMCPHGAMSFNVSAFADPISCVRCGICAAVCPMQAIALNPPHGEKDMAERIRGILTGIESSQSIVALLCRQSASRAMNMAGPGICEGIAPIVVPCAGTVDILHILSAFHAGAAAVLVGGCYEGNCASVYGTTLAKRRVSGAWHMLEEAGIERNRLRFVSLASNTPGEFARAVTELREVVGR